MYRTCAVECWLSYSFYSHLYLYLWPFCTSVLTEKKELICAVVNTERGLCGVGLWMWCLIRFHNCRQYCFYGRIFNEWIFILVGAWRTFFIQISETTKKIVFTADLTRFRTRRFALSSILEKFFGYLHNYYGLFIPSFSNLFNLVKI